MGEPDIAATARTLEGLGAKDVSATVRPFEIDETVAATAAGPRTLPPEALPTLRLGSANDSTTDLERRGVLGEGGMGIVELARQRSLAREVAVKRLRGDVSDANAVRGLLAEASFTGYLEHPSIVPVHAIGHDTALGPLMVMKKVEGVTLAALLADPADPGWRAARGERLAWLVRCLVEVAHALELAHDRGVLHRDIKPENVMIGGFGEVYLLDWGVAIRASDAASLPMNAIAGTPAFMAPEMLRPGDGQTGVRTDVYLLGATLHSVLTGGELRHPGTTLAAVLVGASQSDPIEYPSEVPAELGAIANRATARDPKERFASASELREALEAWLEHRASAELASAAQEKLLDLRALLATEAPDPALVHPLFHACRFGLEQALRGWPDNVLAVAALREALEAMVRFEIAEQNLASARAIAADLEPLPQELSDALRALEAEIAAEAETKKRLEAIAHELDPLVSRRQRILAMRILAVLALVIAAASLVAEAVGVPMLDPRTPAFGYAIFAELPLIGIAVGVLIRYRKIFLRTQINRLMALTIFVTAGFVVIHRVIGMLRGNDIATMIGGDSLIVALACALAALSIRRIFVVPAVLFVVTSFIGAASVEWSIRVATGAVILSILFMLFVGDRWPDPLIGRLRPTDEGRGES